MKAVCNASPLITLSKAGLVHVLDALFDRVVVPDAVVREVDDAGPEDPGRRALAQLPWLERVVLAPAVSRLGTVQLGAGEAEVIEWGLRNPEFIALLDDRAARRVAVSLGVRTAGTLRILFVAASKGIVSSFPEAVAQVRAAGLYCDERVIRDVQRLLEDRGEQP
jgi:predicted nucleic acid-binding protein